MKKTIKIKLSGIIFHIDDDAYSLLRKYLDSLNDYFKAKKEGKEVMQDIESRIAEIFQQKINVSKEVISQEDVTSTIEVMGEAKDIIDEEDLQDPGTEKRHTQSGRRLYRDPDNAVLGGVCGGLGAYFNTDPIWFRIIFLILLLVYGAGLVYIILWIVLPKAETSAQKLEMKGENITVHNIEKTVKEEFDNVKSNFSKIKGSQGFSRIIDAINNFFKAIGMIFLLILRAVLVLIGVVLVLVGFISLVSFLGVLLFSNSLFFPDIFDIPRFYLPHILPIFTDTGNIPLLIIALLLVILIPLVALIYGGIKIIFRLKVKDKAIGLIAFIIWIISLASLTSIAVFEGVNFSKNASIKTTHVLDYSGYDTIYLAMQEKPYNFQHQDMFSFEFDHQGIYRDPETGTIFGKSDLNIEISESGKLELEVRKGSKGRSSEMAWEHAREIDYHWETIDSLLLFDHYFQLPVKQRWRAPYMKLSLKIPEGKVVIIDAALISILRKVQSPEYYRSYGLVNKAWQATKDGLVELED